MFNSVHIMFCLPVTRRAISEWMVAEKKMRFTPVCIWVFFFPVKRHAIRDCRVNSLGARAGGVIVDLVSATLRQSRHAVRAHHERLAPRLVHAVSHVRTIETQR